MVANIKHCILFPNNSTSVILGQNLVSDLADLSFFIPDGAPHQQAAFTCYDEVKIASAGLDVKVTKIDQYSHLKDFDYLIFPCLDINPRKSSKQFVDMNGNLFQ